MLKRVLSSVLCVVVMVVVMYAMAEAGTGTVSGTSISQCLCFNAAGALVACPGTFKKCSVDVNTLLKSLGNTTSGPNATNTAYAVTLFLENAQVFCVNGGGNAENANGQPFQQIVTVQQTDVITNKRIDRNGKATSDLLFSDAQLLSGTGFTSADLCQNKNWTAKIFVENLQAYGRLFQDDDPSAACNLDPTKGAVTFAGCGLADALDVECTAPAGATVTNTFTYSCDTLCHNDAGSTCPTKAGPANDPFTACFVNPDSPTTCLTTP